MDHFVITHLLNTDSGAMRVPVVQDTHMVCVNAIFSKEYKPMCSPSNGLVHKHDEDEATDALPLVELLCGLIEERDLVPHDFPNDGDPLPKDEQIMLIVKAMDLKKWEQAEAFARKIGFRFKWNTDMSITRALTLWLKKQ